MSEEPGPFREDARPSAPPPKLSVTAAIALPLVLVGWGSVWAAFSTGTDGFLVMAAVCLLSGAVSGGLGMVETRPIIDEETGRSWNPYRGRAAATLALGALLAPLILGCIAFGLLLLTCGGH